MSDDPTLDYLRGYIDGYWEGYDYAREDIVTDDVGDGEVEGAAGSVDASSGRSPLASGASEMHRPAPAGAGSGRSPQASGSRPSSLPTIGQAANSGRLRHDIEALYVHRGMVMALRALRESFADMHWDEATAYCDQVYLSLRSSNLRKLS